jgi:hypothetical protein
MLLKDNASDAYEVKHSAHRMLNYQTFTSFSPSVAGGAVPFSVSSGKLVLLRPLLALFVLLASLSASLSALLSFSTSKPVFVSSWCLSRTFTPMNREINSPTAPNTAYKIHILLKLLANASLAMDRCASGRLLMRPTFAPAEPPPKDDAVWSPREVRRNPCCPFISF